MILCPPSKHVEYRAPDGLDQIAFGLALACSAGLTALFRKWTHDYSLLVPLAFSLFELPHQRLLRRVQSRFPIAEARLRERPSAPKLAPVAMAFLAGLAALLQLVPSQPLPDSSGTLVAMAFAAAFAGVSIAAGLTLDWPYYQWHAAFCALAAVWMYRSGAGVGGVWLLLAGLGAVIAITGAARFKILLTTSLL